MKRLQVKIATSIYIYLLLLTAACHRYTTEEANLLSVSAMVEPDSRQEILPSNKELLPLKSFIEEVVHLGNHPVRAYRYKEPEGQWSLYFSLTEKEPIVGRYYPYGSYVVWLESPMVLASVGFDAERSALENLLAEPLRAYPRVNSIILSPAKLVALARQKPVPKATWALYEYDHYLGRLFLTHAVEKDGYMIDGYNLIALDGLSIELLEPLGETFMMNVPTFADLVDQLKGYPLLPSNGESWHFEAYLKPVELYLTNQIRCNLVQQRTINALTSEQLNLVAGSFMSGEDGSIESYEQQEDYFRVAIYSSRPLAQMSSIWHVGLKGADTKLASSQYEEGYRTVFEKYRHKGLDFEQLIDTDASKLKKGINYGTFMQVVLKETNGVERKSPWLVIDAPWSENLSEVKGQATLMVDHPWLKEHLPSLKEVAAYDRLELYYLDEQMRIQKISYNNLFTLIFEAQRLFEFTNAYVLYEKNRG